MRTSYAEPLHLTSKGAQHLSTFLDLETVLLEIDPFLMFGWDGRGIDHQTRLALLAGKRNGIDILLVVNEHALFLQTTGNYL